MKMFALSLVMVPLLIAGCSGVAKIPQDLTLRHTTIVAGDAESRVIIDGLPGKGTGFAVGGAVGAGVGAGFGLIACLSTGFLFPACVAAVVPVTTAASAIGAGVYGAAATQSAADMDAKRLLLMDVISERGVSQRLATLVQLKAQESLTVTKSNEEDDSTLPEPEWMLFIVVHELATVGSDWDTPYALKASARVDISSPGKEKPVFSREYQAQSHAKMHTSEWRANGNENIDMTVDSLLAELATDIIHDLIPAERNGEVVTADALLPSSGWPDAKGDIDINDQTHLFDDKTGMNWTVLPSLPVVLDTAKHQCAAINIAGSPEYRLPALHEFEKLWQAYKEDERIRIFNKKEYNTRDEDSLTRFGYTKTFSFADGTSGNLYAAYLACVSQ